jgi:hypothetical protein
MNVVHIEDKAFMGILLAAVEAFPSKFNKGQRKPNGASPEGEVHGLLFGERAVADNNTTVHKITLSVPNQIVLERTGDSVSVSSVHIDRIREVMKRFPKYSLLGFYHSHPYKRAEFHKTGCVEPSETDVADAASAVEGAEGDMLDLIIGLTRLEGQSTVSSCSPERHMIHASCGKYKYTLACCVASVNKQVNPESYFCYDPVDDLICAAAAG